MQPDGSTALDKSNTATKFLLDQTVGALVNTAIFIGTFAAFKGKNGPAIQRDVRRVGPLFPWFPSGPHPVRRKHYL